MAEIEYVDYLEDDFSIVIRLVTQRGLVTDFAAVLHEGDQIITKWDCAHAMIHRDVYGQKGALIRKEQRTSYSLGEAFIYAVQDLKKNYRRYASERRSAN